MRGLDLNKTQVLNHSDCVQDICAPILAPIGISYFNYIKIYHHDCSRELLTNNPAWINHFYKNELYKSIGAVDVEHLLPKGYFLWSEMDTKDPIYLQGRDFFNIDNGISFVIKRKDVTYLYIFASNRSKHEINNFYISNIDLLQRFIHYFNDVGQNLIKSAEENRIFLPERQNIIQDRVNNIIISNEAKKEFMNLTKVNRYFLLNESDDLYITAKQAECASLLTKGYTAKQMAKIMKISYRTVEGYILEIKKKIQDKTNTILTKDKLIEILRHSNFH